MTDEPYPPRSATAAAMNRLNALLGLKPGPYCQDWDLEMADPARVREFIGWYDREPLTDDEQSALMGLVVASYDEALRAGTADPADGDRIAARLRGRWDLHGYTVQYWACPGAPDDYEDLWAVAPLMRRVWADRPGP